MKGNKSPIFVRGQISKQAESRFKARVRKDLEGLNNCYFFKVQQVALRGIPDFIICLSGRFVALELKRSEKERPDPLQQWTLDAIANAGGISFIANPTNWFDTLDVLKHLSEMEVEGDMNVHH